MPKRICWKKGMRLTDEVLRASDQSTIELFNNAFALAAAGRFGLLPSATTPFEISLNISKGLIDVITLNCIAITRGGDLIEARYDTRYTNAFNTRVIIPDNPGASELILIINANSDSWTETNNGYEEPAYTFSLILPDTLVPSNAMPIARIVDSEFGGWRIDDAEFVPPCLFVASHPKFREQLDKLTEVLSSMDMKAHGLLNSPGKNIARIFWPLLQQLLITIDKEADLMTPMALLANVQKCVSAFTCACDLDDYLELEDADIFRNYVMKPFSYKTVYSTIKEGLDICVQISEKLEKLQTATAPQPAPGLPEAPTIDPSQLTKQCTNSTCRITLTNNEPGATIYYTTDGSEPTTSSKKGPNVSVDTGFSNTRTKEENKLATIKAIAVLDGVSSKTSTFEVTMIKDISRWTGIAI